jgi:hypothetical protein
LQSLICGCDDAPGRFSRSFAGHGEISVAESPRPNADHTFITVAVTMFEREMTTKTGQTPLIKIFVKSECLEFEESSR